MAQIRKCTMIAAFGVVFAVQSSECATETTFAPNADARVWNDFVDKGYTSQWKDGTLPVTGDSIVLSTEKATGVSPTPSLLTHLKRLIVNWPSNVQNYKLTGDNTWILDNRNLNSAASSYKFGDMSDFYGWIRFTTIP